ncbi:AraC family transcriptional regulator [Aquimarina sp. U1-2]|nr:AraC family transcriptional regulator [Aquimarina sp. U1-2]
MFSQKEKVIPVDSINKLDFSGLINGINTNLEKNPELADFYSNVFLRRAKENKNDYEISSAYYYRSTLYINDLERQITYIDSAIYITTNTKNKNDFKSHKGTLVYLKTHKGAVYETDGFFDIALDNYLEALDLAKKTNDSLYIYYLQHNIGIQRRKFGQFEKAKILFQKCLKYQESIVNKSSNDSLNYLFTLAELVTTYRQHKELDSAILTNKIGLQRSRHKTIQSLFKLNQGILQYYDQDYSKAITTIKGAVDTLLKPKNHIYFENYDLIDAYYFSGKSYEALKNKDEGIKYYKKIDSILQHTNYRIPKTRYAYLELIKYYKSIGDKNNQLYYINQLIKNDSVVDRNFKNMNTKLIREYETPLLLEEKELLIDELKTQNTRSNFSLILLLGSIIILTGIFIRNYKKNRQYKLRFNELINQKHEEKVKNESSNREERIDIAKDVVDMILKKLIHFEQTHGFLKTSLTSVILASKFSTNSKYLTKVIKFYRGKSFTLYINDLRINYIIEQLQSNTKLQNYTIKALAAEAGFNSTEVFSKTFFKKTGLHPSYFVKRLRELKEN